MGHLEHTLHGHCQVGDVKCLERHKKVGIGITLRTEHLLENLEYLTKVEDSVDKLLMKMNIPHIHVTYENLYHSNNAKEWNKLKTLWPMFLHLATNMKRYYLISNK